MIRIALVLTLTFTALCVRATTIIINGEDDWAPYSSASPDYKDVIGLAPDIIKAAFKSQGVRVITRPVPFARCLHEVEEGKALACFDTVISIETEGKYIFHSTPLFEADMVVYGAPNESKRPMTFKDLEGKVVGTTNGYTYPTEFLQNKRITHSPGPTEKSQLEKLASGRVHYAVLWGLTASYLLQENPSLSSKVKPLGVISRKGLYLSFSKKYKDGAKYAGILEKGLQTILSNGTYARITGKFNAIHVENPKP
ncbi:transporter substrate-binding domain-containing protein [Bdellovibrio sp.]|uniref:substrate-binding periplasmic protein n=1 Tax=Bdellovibrio TaxID=958 RepID=UPI003221B58B